MIFLRNIPLGLFFASVLPCVVSGHRGHDVSYAYKTRAQSRTDSNQPNFIFIITDDQDLLLNSVEYQPQVQKHFGDQGTFFSKHFCTVSLCCPSRVSLLTGKAAHNTNVTNVSPPYGQYF